MVSVTRACAILGKIPPEIYSNPQRLDVLLEIINAMQKYDFSDEEIKLWMASPFGGKYKTPLEMIAEGRGQIIFDRLGRFAHGILQ